VIAVIVFHRVLSQLAVKAQHPRDQGVMPPCKPSPAPPICPKQGKATLRCGTAGAHQCMRHTSETLCGPELSPMCHAAQRICSKPSACAHSKALSTGIPLYPPACQVNPFKKYTPPLSGHQKGDMHRRPSTLSHIATAAFFSLCVAVSDARRLTAACKTPSSPFSMTPRST
jgi:hypothetical protein